MEEQCGQMKEKQNSCHAEDHLQGDQGRPVSAGRQGGPFPVVEGRISVYQLKTQGSWKSGS